MKVEAILLDCGGVMVSSSTGDWMLPPGFEATLGDAFTRDRLVEFRRIRNDLIDLIPDTHQIATDDEEYALFIECYRAVFARMGVDIDDDALQRLSHAQVHLDERYNFFDDVLPSLARWHGRYKLGIVSDAPPSTRRILTSAGVMAYMDAATFSCDLGLLKPDPRIYRATLDKLGVAPEAAIFVDDYPSKLRGAVDIGIRGVQMRRQMHPLYAIPPLWDGPIAHDFAELERIVGAME